MGHEFCGVVTNLGDSGFRIGDRVVYWANMYCGRCDMCLAGKEQLCREGWKKRRGFLSGNGEYGADGQADPAGACVLCGKYGAV